MTSCNSFDLQEVICKSSKIQGYFSGFVKFLFFHIQHTYTSVSANFSQIKSKISALEQHLKPTTSATLISTTSAQDISPPFSEYGFI